MRYDKLVRDKIPDKILKNGETPIFHIAGDAEYYEKLKDKVSEEINEVADAASHEILEELADLKEVALAILDFGNISINEIRVNQGNETLIEADDFKKEIKIKVGNILGFIDIICSMNSINNEEIEKVRLEKLEKNGGFSKRIILEETL